MTGDDLAALLSWVAHITGYPQPTTPPIVIVEPAAYFEHAGIAGTASDGAIHVRSLEDECFIVHEFTHLLQPADMPRCLRERQAYGVQIQWATENGVLTCRPLTAEHEVC